jgi:hypothetical protein
MSALSPPTPDEEPTDAELSTAWERDFLASIECQDFDLTELQEEKREEVYARLDERREARRDSLSLPPLSEGQSRMLVKREQILERRRQAWHRSRS